MVGQIYARPDSFYSHRPFDGGVILGTGGPAHGSHAIRMSKKYVRYQSGKSIMYNTGLLLAPNYDIRSLAATNNSATTYTQTTSGTNSAGSTSLVLGSGTNTANNQIVSGTGIAPGTYIVSGGGTTTLTLNLPIAATISGGATITFTPGITVTTDDIDHSLQTGAQIEISGVITSGYNSIYTVGAIVDERTFIVPVPGALGNVTAVIGSPCLMSTLGWVGSTVRAGTFDDQNGQFWQYDGQTISVGYRSSTFQTAGVVSVTPDSNAITQSSAAVPTRFQEQFAEGDRVVVRGMTHIVTSIVSNTLMYVTPDYRGASVQTGVKMVKTRDFIFKQSEWNIDRCDGSNGPFNPSGYRINVNKMQMVGLAWTWYGAGFIEWMLRGPDGNYIAVHRVKASNVNTEAYMRSGNQPVRYEVINEGPRTQLGATALAADTTITVKDTSLFPTAGYLWMEGEIIQYTGKTQSVKYDQATDTGTGTFTGLTRAATNFLYFVAGSNRTFTGSRVAHPSTAANTGVILLNQLATPVISHWGSAFLQDGGFDADRGYIFNYAATNVPVSTRKATAFAIRLAPSVSNAIIGDLGVRDLLNRAQLLLQGIEITAGGASGTNTAIVIEGVLNPLNFPTDPGSINWQTLQTSANGGLPSFTQIAAGSAITFAGQVPAVIPAVVAPVAALSGATSITATIPTALSVTAISGSGTVTIASSTTFTANQPVALTGTPSSGSVTGYLSGTIYYVRDAGATTTPTLLTSPSGPTITGTAGSTITGFGMVVNPPLIGDDVVTTTPGVYFAGNTKVASTVTYGAGANPTTAIIPLDRALLSPISTAATFASSTNAGTAGTNIITTSTSVTNTPIAGMTIVGSANIPAGTIITAVSGSTPNFTITLSNTLNATIANASLSGASSGVIIVVSRGTAAIPGETIFSFISSPQNKDSLDLSPLKELVNTPLGGRGCFPNGPDVLMVNVYLTQGIAATTSSSAAASLLSNLVLRWGEAQA